MALPNSPWYSSAQKLAWLHIIIKYSPVVIRFQAIWLVRWSPFISSYSSDWLYMENTRRLVLKKTVFLRGRVRWIWVCSTKVDVVCLSPVHMWDMMTSEEGSRTEPKLLTRRQFSESWTKTEEGRKQERDTTNIPYQPLLIKPIYIWKRTGNSTYFQINICRWKIICYCI